MEDSIERDDLEVSYTERNIRCILCREDLEVFLTEKRS